MGSYEDTQEANADEARDYAHELRTERGNARLLTDIAKQQPETDETSVRSGGADVRVEGRP